MGRRIPLVFGALAALACLVLVGAIFAGPHSSAAASASAQSDPPHQPVPSSLSDADFWRFVTEHSEPSGSFPRENLTSNEAFFQYVIPDLLRRARPGRVYLGVGPEQNFTYIAALQPAMAVVFDIRRGNLDVQLMYKAIFELAADRADFMAILFSRPRPPGLGPSSSVVELFSAFAGVHSSKAVYERNLKAIDDRLSKTHGFALRADDLEWIEYVFSTFYREGYAVRPSPSYADLMTATDGAGAFRSYLATEANFSVLKTLEARNLVIPLVGDFAGTKAVRGVAAYLKAHDATVSAFYLSNVEDYLYQDRKWEAFCRNVAMLPLDQSSTFIRSTSRGRPPGGFGGYYGGFVSSLGRMTDEVKACR